MKKQLIIVGMAVLLICVGLSGCTEDNDSTLLITIDNYKIYPNGIFYESSKRFLEPDEGNVILLVNITTTTTDMEMPLSAYWFEILTEDGRVYNAIRIEGNLPDSLMYRSTLSFFVLFELPDNVITKKLVYDFSNIHGQSVRGEASLSIQV